MSTTIGRHWDGPRGDRQARCDYCGVIWRRSQLVKDGSGLLRCPDEGEGEDATTLSNENAAGAMEYMGRYDREEGGVPPQPFSDPSIVPLRTKIGGTF